MATCSINGKITAASTDTGWVIFLFNTLSRFSVPCFVMLSGAFILGSPYNGDKKFFYRKALKSTMLTTVIFQYYILSILCSRQHLGIYMFMMMVFLQF